MPDIEPDNDVQQGQQAQLPNRSQGVDTSPAGNAADLKTSTGVAPDAGAGSTGSSGTSASSPTPNPNPPLPRVVLTSDEPPQIDPKQAAVTSAPDLQPTPPPAGSVLTHQGQQYSAQTAAGPVNLVDAQIALGGSDDFDAVAMDTSGQSSGTVLRVTLSSASEPSDDTLIKDDVNTSFGGGGGRPRGFLDSGGEPTSLSTPPSTPPSSWVDHAPTLDPDLHSHDEPAAPVLQPQAASAPLPSIDGLASQQDSPPVAPRGGSDSHGGAEPPSSSTTSASLTPRSGDTLPPISATSSPFSTTEPALRQASPSQQRGVQDSPAQTLQPVTPSPEKAPRVPKVSSDASLPASKIVQTPQQRAVPAAKQLSGSGAVQTSTSARVIPVQAAVAKSEPAASVQPRSTEMRVPVNSGAAVKSAPSASTREAATKPVALQESSKPNVTTGAPTSAARAGDVLTIARSSGGNDGNKNIKLTSEVIPSIAKDTGAKIIIPTQAKGELISAAPKDKVAQTGGVKVGGSELKVTTVVPKGDGLNPSGPEKSAERVSDKGVPKSGEISADARNKSKSEELVGVKTLPIKSEPLSPQLLKKYQSYIEKIERLAGKAGLTAGKTEKSILGEIKKLGERGMQEKAAAGKITATVAEVKDKLLQILGIKTVVPERSVQGVVGKAVSEKVVSLIKDRLAVAIKEGSPLTKILGEVLDKRVGELVSTPKDASQVITRAVALKLLLTGVTNIENPIVQEVKLETKNKLDQVMGVIKDAAVLFSKGEKINEDQFKQLMQEVIAEASKLHGLTDEQRVLLSQMLVALSKETPGVENKPKEQTDKEKAQNIQNKPEIIVPEFAEKYLTSAAIAELLKNPETQISVDERRQLEELLKILNELNESAESELEEEFEYLLDAGLKVVKVYILTVRVVGKNKSPLPEVLVSGGYFGEALTNSEGIMKFKNIPEKTQFLLTASAEGMVFKPVLVTDTMSHSMTVTFEAVED